MTETSLKSWAEYVDRLKGADRILEATWKPDDEAYRADVYRQIMMNLSLGYFAYFQSDPHHPDWLPLWNSVFMLQPNPDDIYLYAPLDSNCSYRISGDAGNLRLLSFTIGGDLIGIAREPGPGSSYFDHRTLKIGSDGQLDILFSQERPVGYDGNWAKLAERDDYMIMRQRCYDWGNEREPRLSIECLDPPSRHLKPRMSVPQIADKLDLLVGFSDRLSGLFYKWQNDLRDRKGINIFELTRFSEWGGVAMQQYWQAAFVFSPDEALILETEIPDLAPYWNVQLNDPFFNAIEFIYRQSSLNGHTAKLDPDGKFRAVIALEDPGVANWLDPVGYTEGTVIGRWYDTGTFPIPTLRRVPVADLHKLLPAESPRRTPDERQEDLRKRRAGAQRRKRW